MIENINVGSTPNDNTGDTLRDSFIKINNNDNYLDGKFDDYVLTDLLDVELGIINTEIADINTAIDNLSDVFVSGGTYLDGTATFVNTTGGTFDVSGFSEDTTYQISASQVDANVKISLSGSDLSSETIVLIAGDNITLTDDGSNNITIDAAGGGATTSSNNTLIGNRYPYYAKQNYTNTTYDSWNASVLAGSFSILYGIQITEKTMFFLPVVLGENTTLNDFRFGIYTASASKLISFGIYDSELIVDSGNTYIKPANLLITELNIEATTAGFRTITDLNLTVTGSPENLYWICLGNPTSTGADNPSIYSIQNYNFGGSVVTHGKASFVDGAVVPTQFNTNDYLRIGGYAEAPVFASLPLYIDTEVSGPLYGAGTEISNGTKSMPYCFWR